MMQPENRNEKGQACGRRSFLKLSTAAGLGAAWMARAGSGQLLAAPMPSGPMKSKPMDVVRIGFVGVGGMGMNHVRNLLRIEGVELRAVCDIVEDKVAAAQDAAVKAGQKKPEGYCAGPQGYLKLCDREDIDLVYNATPWQFHAPICLAAMKAGKHAATEVPAACTVEECWQLVETAEKTSKHCVMMENCCYDRSEMMVLNMVRKGVFGELLHGECGYLHDLRSIKFSDNGEGLWRLDHSIKRDANLYPTHGLGPIAQYMNINRGDRLDYLVSMSTPSRGLNNYAAEKFGADSPKAKQKYALGDVNLSLIKTANGLTIYLVHDCDTPRPYSRINMIQGTKGIFEGFPDRIHIEGRSKGHDWEQLDAYRQEFEHPLWKRMEEKAKGAGHGGMDFIEDTRLVECLRAGEPLDMDVYDAAMLSVITPLTEESVAHRSKTMDVPDFTRGKWKTTKPWGTFA